ncbi:MAG: xanthine dehydrogenase accessory protein XdhC [Gammaproteobacteria bacterium]|nr:xanthine dehydrogenase accessory protein XdhC [Gammaproteobacteria bacterium]
MTAGIGQWLKPLREWPRALQGALLREAAVARVVLAGVSGSAPREAGTCMLVGNGGLDGSIGGGQLEWQAQTEARRLLAQSRASAVTLRRFVLGPDLGQCCGGVVDLWIERFTDADLEVVQAIETAGRCGPVVLATTVTPREVLRRLFSAPDGSAEIEELLRARRGKAAARLIRAANGSVTLLERVDDPLPPVWLYGAGHVGQAIARICAELPMSLTWIDSRAEILPPSPPQSVTVVCEPKPSRTVPMAPTGTSFLVLTHSHALDYELCRAILERDDFAWLGLIGSKSKSARFRSRLARDGLAHASISRLVCPIGIRAIESKWPAAIAVGIAAQLMGAVDADELVRSDVAARSSDTQPPPDCAAQSCGACRRPTSYVPVAASEGSGSSDP